MSKKLVRHIEILETIYKKPDSMPLETRIKLAPHRFYLMASGCTETINYDSLDISNKNHVITEKIKGVKSFSDLPSGYARYDNFTGNVTGISFVYSRSK